MSTFSEKNNVEYEKHGDYILPCVKLPEESEMSVGVWGVRSRTYLKEYKQIQYYNLLTAGTLVRHLSDTDNRAIKMFDSLVQSFAEKENVTEELKSENPMEWVSKMNNIRNRATEIVNRKIIYV